MGTTGRRWGQQVVAVLGRSCVFWPIFLVVVLLGRPWTPRWSWLVALVVAGPVLALALWRASSRDLRSLTVSPGLRGERLLARLRGERPGR